MTTFRTGLSRRPVRSLVREISKEFDWLSQESRAAKILFDHLPRCGGTTLKAYLASHYPRRKTYNLSGADPGSSVRIFTSFSEAQQRGYHLIMGHLANELEPLVDPVCIHCTLLRNPVDRFASFYYYVRQMPHHYLYGALMREQMTLDDFARSELGEEVRNWLTIHFSGMTRLQAERRPQEAIARALDTCKQIDLVGFVEQYPHFVNRLRTMANLRHEFLPEKLNAVANRTPLSDIPRMTREHIAEVNFLDIDFYDRAYDLFFSEQNDQGVKGNEDRSFSFGK
ncbi:MAG: sulfotransferase family 2 domain-containing protein [Candidatus Promineifilaceae bacterium]